MELPSNKSIQPIATLRREDMTMIHKTCQTIENAISAAMEIAIDWGDSAGDLTNDVWYRGSKDDHDLVPSAYWKDVDELSSIISFNQVVRNLTDTRGFDEWDYYCLARHHGIPDY